MIKQLKNIIIAGFAFSALVAFPWYRGVQSIFTETEIMQIDLNPYLTGITIFFLVIAIVLDVKYANALYIKPERERIYASENDEMYVEDPETGTIGWKPKGSNSSPTLSEKTPILGYTGRK